MTFGINHITIVYDAYNYLTTEITQLPVASSQVTPSGQQCKQCIPTVIYTVIVGIVIDYTCIPGIAIFNVLLNCRHNLLNAEQGYRFLLCTFLIPMELCRTNGECCSIYQTTVSLHEH